MYLRSANTAVWWPRAAASGPGSYTEARGNDFPGRLGAREGRGGVSTVSQGAAAMEASAAAVLHGGVRRTGAVAAQGGGASTGTARRS